ncbi:MAG TPA: hypothetical protein VGD67_19815 [Pseudonocardiaceae bacterium]
MPTNGNAIVPLPRGVATRDGTTVIRPRPAWVAYAWLAVAGPLVVAVGVPLDAARQDRAGAHGADPAAVLVIAAAFGLLALGAAALAVRLGRAAWTADATGLGKRSWRRAAVDWSAVTAIHLRRTGRYWQIWVHAPGAVRRARRARPADRLIVPCVVLAPDPGELHAYLSTLWQNGRTS